MNLKSVLNFLINKKYAFIFVLLFIFLLGYSFFTSFDTYNELASVNTTLVTNKVIVLDAGHGAPDLGAIRI